MKIINIFFISLIYLFVFSVDVKAQVCTGQYRCGTRTCFGCPPGEDCSSPNCTGYGCTVTGAGNINCSGSNQNSCQNVSCAECEEFNYCAWTIPGQTPTPTPVGGGGNSNCGDNQYPTCRNGYCSGNQVCRQGTENGQPTCKCITLPSTCDTVVAPVITAPFGLTCDLNETVDVHWSDVVGASTYSLRINDMSNGWVGDCSLPQNPGDVCINGATSTDYALPIVRGHSYDIWVHAVNSCGEYSPSSNVSSFNVPTTPNSPTNLTPSGNACVSVPANTRVVSWTAPVGGADHYALRVNDTSNGWAGDCGLPQYPGDVCQNNVNTTSYTVNNMVVGHTYEVWVHAVNACGGYSPEVRTTFNALSIPPTPASFSAACSPSGTSVNLTWTDSPTEVGYWLTRSPVFPNPVPTTGVVLPVNTTSYSDSTVTQDTPQVAHQYTIWPYNYCGSTTRTSNVVSACTVYETWFQSGGGGEVVSAGGNLEVVIPPTAPSPYLVLNPSWDLTPVGYPVVYGFLSGSGNLNTTNVSTAGILVDIGQFGSNWSSLALKTENKYAAMSERVISRYGSTDVSDTDITEAEMNNTYLVNAIDNHRITIPGFGATAAEDLQVGVIRLTSTSTVNIQGMIFGNGQVSKGAIIFAEGPVNLAGNITMDDSNFLAIIAKGNITVGANAGTGPTPTAQPYQYVISADSFVSNLRGVFYTEGTFSTGLDSDQLKIEGTVVGLGGINLQRTSVGPNPAEFVKYNPKFTAILREIGLRRKVHYEQVAP